MISTIAELPFHERPVIELLDLGDASRLEVNRDYAGYGWARVEWLWLDATENSAPRPTGRATRSLLAARVDDSREIYAVADALVLALHSMDDAPPVADDVELEFVLAESSVAVLASRFLDIWLPKLPRASAIVLAMCNPHRAAVRVRGEAPIHYALGDVEAWLDEDEHFPGSRIRLAAPTWCTLAP